MSFAPLRRRRGGQPGNTNRLVHGLYSRRLPRELTAPASPRTGDDPQFELVMARVHLVQLLTAQKKAPKRQWLSYERAVIDCLGLILSLISAGVRRRRYQPDVDRIVDDLHHGFLSDNLAGYAASNLYRTSDNDPGFSRNSPVGHGFELSDSQPRHPSGEDFGMKPRSQLGRRSSDAIRSTDGSVLSVGIFWIDHRRGRDLNSTIAKAAAHFRLRYGQQPNIFLFPPGMSSRRDFFDRQLRIRACDAFPPHHFWIGIEAAPLAARSCRTAARGQKKRSV